MVYFGPLTAEISSGVWGTPTNFDGFASWQRYCTASSSGCQLNFAALNRGRHLCLGGRPSCWALAHILVIHVSGCCCFSDINISQGIVAMHLRLWWDVLLLLCWKFTAKSVGERNLRSRSAVDKVLVRNVVAPFFQTRCLYVS